MDYVLTSIIMGYMLHHIINGAEQIEIERVLERLVP